MVTKIGSRITGKMITTQWWTYYTIYIANVKKFEQETEYKFKNY